MLKFLAIATVVDGSVFLYSSQLGAFGALFILLIVFVRNFFPSNS